MMEGGGSGLEREERKEKVVRGMKKDKWMKIKRVRGEENHGGPPPAYSLFFPFLLL